MSQLEGPVVAEPVDKDQSELAMSLAQLVLAGAVGLACAGAGAVAVFETENELGSAALITVGIYFLIAVILRRFPKFTFGGNEIDPMARRLARQANRRSLRAAEDATDAKEGLRAAASRSEFTAPDRGELTALPDARIAELAAEYNTVRWTMPSGPERTRKMTDIVEDMVARFGETGAVPAVETLLTSEDRGVRLAGVAAVYAKPRPDVIPTLVHVGVTPDKPFNEYWALRALGRAVDGQCGDLSPEARRQLRARLRDLPSGTDRAREIRKILEMCP